MNELEKLKNEDSIELEKSNSEIQNMELSKQCIETEIEKLKQYIKSGLGKFKFVRYIDVNEFREREIENKSEAINTIKDMKKLVKNINRVLSEKEKRVNNLLHEKIRVTLLKSSGKNKLRKEIKRGFDERFNEEKENKPAKRLNLSPNKKEILHSKIIEEVNNIIEAGKGTLEQAFQKLSKKSKGLFGYELTPKQIEGRYSRNKKKHF